MGRDECTEGSSQMAIREHIDKTTEAAVQHVRRAMACHAHQHSIHSFCRRMPSVGGDEEELVRHVRPAMPWWDDFPSVAALDSNIIQVAAGFALGSALHQPGGIKLRSSAPERVGGCIWASKAQ